MKFGSSGIIIGIAELLAKSIYGIGETTLLMYG